MKAYLLVVALAVTAACGKQNDAHVLEHEAKVLAKYYQPKLEVLEKRLDEILQQGKSIPGNLPGVREVGTRLGEARDQLVQLKGIVTASSGQKSALEQQAEAAAKENRILDLRKLVQEAEHKLDRGVTIINANLDTAENWARQYERQLLAMATPAAQPSEPTPAAHLSEPAPAEEQPAEPAMTPEPPVAEPAPAQ